MQFVNFIKKGIGMFILVDFHGDEPVIIRAGGGDMGAITFSNEEAADRYKEQTSAWPEEVVAVESPEGPLGS